MKILEEVPQKRKIRYVACLKCRSLKIKCRPSDAEQGRCQYCVRFNRQCLYEDRRKRGPTKKKLTVQTAVSETDGQRDHFLPENDQESRQDQNSVSHDIIEKPEYQSTSRTAGPLSLVAPPSERTDSYGSLYPVPPLSPFFPISNLPQSLSTELLCSRPVLDDLIKTYLTHLYPLTPLIHRPTFIQDLESHREMRDPIFFAMIIALCAFVLAHIPRRFLKYCEMDPGLPYKTPKEMFARCYELVFAIKISPTWISKAAVSLTHFQAVYLISSADSYFEGDPIRSYLGFQEGLAILKSMSVNRWPSGYDDLDNIEIELRKRCFWLIYFVLVMNRVLPRHSNFDFSLCGPQEELISDPVPLIPAEVDDELISRSVILPQPKERLALLAGFVANIRLHLSLEFPRMTDVERLQYLILDTELTGRLIMEQIRVTKILKHISDLVDQIPPELYPPGDGSEVDLELDDLNISNICSASDHWYSTDLPVFRQQLASQRTNLVVTHLWLQSILLDYRDSVFARLARKEENRSELLSWKERQQVCNTLLRVLRGFSLENMELSGPSLIYKLRMMASSLIKHTMTDGNDVLNNAESYLSEILDFMVTLEAHRHKDIEPEGVNLLNS